MRPSFLHVLRGEILKTRRSRGFLLSLLGPLGVSLIIFLYFVKESADFAGSKANLWFTLGRYHFNFFFLLFPLFAALIAFLVSNIEYRANGFKQLFVLPAPKFYFYTSKLIILLGWLLTALALATGLVYGMGYLLEALFPAMPFDRFEPGGAMALFMGRLSLALLSIVAIHYFLSMYFDNFIIAVGSACFLLIFGMMAARWEYGYLIPYAYFSNIFVSYMSGGEGELFGAREAWISLGYAAVFFAGGYGLFARRQVRER